MDFGEVDAVRQTARECAEFGYDEFFTADHLGEADPFSPLLVAAAEEPMLRVGPLVLNNAFHNPALVARTAASMDRMTNGRFVLGLGTGYTQSEHDASGIPLLPPKERVDQFEESVTAIRSLLDTGAAFVDGTHHRVAVEDLGVRPVQERVPILIGGNGRRVVGIAGRHADIFQYTGLTHGPGGAISPGGFRPSDLVKRRAWIEEAAGDRIGDIELSALVQRIAIGADDRGAVAEVCEKWGLSEAEFADCPFALFGTVEQVVDKIHRLRDLLGITHYVVRDPAEFAPVIEAVRGG